MARSDWDILLIGPDGKTLNDDCIRNSAGAVVEPYKGSLLIHHPKMWFDGCGFSKPIIARMSSGNIELAGLDIYTNLSFDNDKRTLFFFVRDYSESDSVISGRVSGSIGSCYAGVITEGFISIWEWIKINHPEIYNQVPEKFRDHLFSTSSSSSKHDKWDLFFVEGYNSDDIWSSETERETFTLNVTSVPRPDLGQCWVGVTKSQIDVLVQWIKKVDYSDTYYQNSGEKPFADRIDVSSIKRFNAGDALIAKLTGNTCEKSNIQSPPK